MERVLVALEPGKTSIWTVVHGLNLARRIRARVFILLVSETRVAEGVERRLREDLQEEIESLIEEARSEEIEVELYMAYGEYDDEVVRFIKDNKITLLVLGVPLSKRGGTTSKFLDLVERIRGRVECRIEIVNEKGIKMTKKGSK